MLPFIKDHMVKGCFTRKPLIMSSGSPILLILHHTVDSMLSKMLKLIAPKISPIKITQQQAPGAN